MNRISFYAAALLPVVLVAACGGGDQAAAPRPTTSPSATAPAPSGSPSSPTPSPTPSSSPSPSPSPTERPPRIATATNGRNLNACRDGKCEVVVRSGDVLRFAGRLKTEPITIFSAGRTFYFMTATGFGGTVTGTAIVETGRVKIEIGQSSKGRTALRISPRGRSKP
jgi:hypothetical protein